MSKNVKAVVWYGTTNKAPDHLTIPPKVLTMLKNRVGTSRVVQVPSEGKNVEIDFRKVSRVEGPNG